MKWDFLNDFQPLWHVRLLIYLNYFFFYRWAKILWMRTFSFCPFYGRPFWSLLSLLFQFPNQLSRLSFEYVLSMTFLKVGKAPQNLVWRVCDVVSPEIIEKNDEMMKKTRKIQLKNTVFENYSKCHILILAFLPFFVLLKLTCLVTLFGRRFPKTRKIKTWPSMAFLINFCLLKM